MNAALRSALLAGALALATASAQAQQFSFASSTLSAAPGGTATIEVFLSGAPSGVAAANFTVRLAATAGSQVRFDQATSTSPLQASGFTYEFNRALSRSGVANGTIQGNVVEFRGVLYPSGGAVTTFGAGSSTKIAEIVVPIAAGASGSFQVELVSAVDSSVGLLGVSNASGASLVPTGQARPGGGLLTINVSDPVVPGDVSGDGAVTPHDAQLAFQCFLLGSCPPAAVNAAAANFCGGPAVTPSDAQGIFNQFLGRTPPCP